MHMIADLANYRMELGSTLMSWSKVDGICDDKVFLLGSDRLGLSDFGASCSVSASGGNIIYFLNHISTELASHMLQEVGGVVVMAVA
uniref:Uncharacterized protein n=1 Tax=Oryza punctata TaxID=4537 RepID=A0A0E0LD07_ORYPU